MDNKKKSILVGVGSCAGIALIAGAVFAFSPSYAEPQTEQLSSSWSSPIMKSVFDEMSAVELFPTYLYEEEGYDNLKDWWTAVTDTRNEYAGIADSIYNEYSDFISDEEYAQIQEYESNISNACNLATIEENAVLIDEIQTALEEEKANAYVAPVATAPVEQEFVYTDNYSNNSTYYSDGDGLTMSGGVNYHNGRKETWYSSNVLYHYRTNEWTVDSEGFYRDSNGRYVVAASDMAQGTVFQGSKGECVVLDSGCAGGTTDYYVAW